MSFIFYVPDNRNSVILYKGDGVKTRTVIRICGEQVYLMKNCWELVKYGSLTGSMRGLKEIGI